MNDLFLVVLIGAGIGMAGAMRDGDRLPGGLADRYRPKDFDQKQLRRGTKVEMKEHTRDRGIAREIAMDHLREDPNYYRELAKMERKLKRKRKQKRKS